MSLSRKVASTLGMVLALAMLGTAALGYFKFISVQSGLVDSRYSFVLFGIKRTIENNLNLGFALRQVRQVQEAVELEKARATRIIGIEVFDQKGEVLFASDRGTLGTEVPRSWLFSLANAGAGATFSISDDDAAGVGLPLINALGTVEGAVVLLYPKGMVEAQLGARLGPLTRDFLLSLALALAVATIGAFLILGAVTRRLKGLEDTLIATMQGKNPALPPGAEDFEEGFLRFAQRTREAAQQVGESILDVERLDRLS